MVTKSKKEGSGKKEKIKVLQLNKEIIKNLTTDQAKKIKGAQPQPSYSGHSCPLPKLPGR